MIHFFELDDGKWTIRERFTGKIYAENKVHSIRIEPHFFNSNDVFYLNSGKLHREDGPAFIGRNRIFWYRNGEWHREDGPAIEYPRLMKLNNWYINGNKITKEVLEWIKDNNLPNYNEWDDAIKIMFKLKFL